MRKILVILILFKFIILPSFGQESAAYFVQFKISTVTSEEQAKTIDKKIGSKKGILTTHTDYKTSTYFCTLELETAYTFENFESWFSKLGFSISCFNKGLQGAGTMISPHQLKNCDKNNKPD